MLLTSRKISFVFRHKNIFVSKYPMYLASDLLGSTLMVQNNENSSQFCTNNAYFGVRNGSPLQYSCLENSMDRGAWWALVHAVTESWTQLS